MPKFLFALLVCAVAFSPVFAQVEPYDLTVEYMTAPVGIDEAAPRLSWKSRATEPGLKNVTQTAYRVLVASSPEILAENRGDLWDSGKVESDKSLNIEYAGAPLKTSQRCHWKVEVTYKTPDAQFSRYSGASRWITAVMHPEDWKAKWIAHQSIEASMPEAKWIWTGETESLGKAPGGTRYYHMGFGASVKWEQLEQATLAITADDRYEIWLNGEKIVETWGHVADWRWVRHYDLVDKLHARNILGVVVHNDTEGPTGLLARIDMSFCGYDEGAPTGYATTMQYETGPNWYWANDVKEGWSTLEKCDENDWKPVVEVGEIGCEPWGALKDAAPISNPNYGSDPSYAREFKVEKPVKQATLHISGLGFYEAFLNGTKIGNKVLDPAQTRYDKRVLYSTYDLTDELRKGENDLRVDLGYGWFCVRTVSVWNFDIAPWKDVPQMIAQLEIEYEDGSKEYVVSDESWKCVGKPMRDYYNCIRQGEYVLGHDKSEEDRGPVSIPVLTVPGPQGKLVAEAIPASVVVEEIKPLSITPKGNGYLVDFGRNIAGWVRLTMVDQTTMRYRGSGYSTPDRYWVVIQYGERLNEHGMLDQKPIDCFFKQGNPLFIDGYMHEYRAGNFQTDIYVPTNHRDPKTQVFEPRFTYHGFRYVQIEGLSKPLTAENITACVVHNDFKTVGKFECSSELLNKIQAATVLSYKGNFVNGVPTDCPHREKNGWTGDAQLASELAQYNFDNTACYEKWIDDLMDEQQPDGNLPGIVPTSGWGYAWGNGPAWDSAICIIPMMLYQYKGNRRILERAYPAMKKYVDYLTNRAREDGLVYHGLSDWCTAKTQTDAVVTSSVYYYLDAAIVAGAAELLGKKEDAQKYFALAEKIRETYQTKFLKPDGTVANGSQTAQSFGLHYSIFAFDDDFADKEEKIFAKLVEAVEKADDHLDVGILGAKTLFHVLSEFDRTDLAMKVLNQKTAPGYGDWFERGATTLWEDWGDGASRNHVMFGDVSTWFYQTLAGIQCGHPGFRDVSIEPEYPEELDWVHAEHDSPYGPIKVDWHREAGKIKLNFTVPINATATYDGKRFGSGDYSFEFDAP